MLMEGYRYFLDKLHPDYVICYGKPLPGMTGDLILFSYEEAFPPSKKGVQEELFEVSRWIHKEI